MIQDRQAGQDGSGRVHLSQRYAVWWCYSEVCGHGMDVTGCMTRKAQRVRQGGYGKDRSSAWAPHGKESTRVFRGKGYLSLTSGSGEWFGVQLYARSISRARAGSKRLRAVPWVCRKSGCFRVYVARGWRVGRNRVQRSSIGQGEIFGGYLCSWHMMMMYERQTMTLPDS